MRASNFEFRYRFWFIAGIFWVGFWMYFFDHRNAGQALAGWMSAQDGRSLDFNFRLIMWIAAAVAALAAGIRLWATAYLRAEVMSDPQLRTERLVADGPYRHVRNPLYLGTNLIALAMTPLASRLGAVILVVGIFLFNLRLIDREEAELRAAQGESYARFMAAIPRLLPALRARVPASGARPHWRQALAGEGFIISFALAVAVFAATQSLRWFYSFIAAGFLVAFLGRVAVTRKNPETGSSQT